jgi:hypothetical protein
VSQIKGRTQVRILEDRLLRRIIGTKRAGILGDRRKLRNGKRKELSL